MHLSGFKLLPKGLCPRSCVPDSRGMSPKMKVHFVGTTVTCFHTCCSSRAPVCQHWICCNPMGEQHRNEQSNSSTFSDLQTKFQVLCHKVVVKLERMMLNTSYLASSGIPMLDADQVEITGAALRGSTPAATIQIAHPGCIWICHQESQPASAFSC